MTTPNGDFVANTNPDHKRHYTRSQLEARLSGAFADVRVVYAIRDGRWRNLGLRSWSPRHPLQTLTSMLGNVISGWQSGRVGSDEAVGTRHLIAMAKRS